MIFPAKSSADPELAAKAPSTTNPIEHQHSLLHHAVGKDQELLPGIEKLFLHVREMENKYNAIKDGHFDASEARNRRPPKPPVYGENDGRPPDTIAALAAATATGVEPSPALVHAAPNPPINYSPRLLQSFKWESPNSCFFDSPLEVWFRAFSLWSAAERVQFLASLPSASALAKFFHIFQRRLIWISKGRNVDIHGIRDLSLYQLHARMLIFSRWKLYNGKHEYGNATSWLSYAIRDSGTSTDVQLHFRIAHFVVEACPSGHSSLVGLNGPVADVLSINLFDLQVARAISGTEASLTEYFANCTPRNLEGNETSGTYLVHSQPAPICTAPDCPNHFQPEFIETRWPKLLQINPDTGAQPRLALARTFTVSDYQGMVTYELTSRTFNEVVSTYTKALTIYSAIPPPSPGSTLVNTPPASPAAPAEEINPGPLAMFLFNGMPPDPAQFPELPPPSEWCGGCRQIAVAGDNTVLQCTVCDFNYHLKCLLKADPIMDLEHVDEFCCPACLSSLDNGQTLWSDDLLGEYLMFQTHLGSAYYPARVAGTTSTGMVRVEWYKDNIYEQTDEPAETDFVCSQQECADTAAQEPEGKYDRTNVGAIKWPPRFVDDAYQLYDYRNPKISCALSDAHKSVVAIIKAADFTMHPILSDYDAWMAEAPQAKEVKHAEAFIQKFSSATILARDASLYEIGHQTVPYFYGMTARKNGYVPVPSTGSQHHSTLRTGSDQLVSLSGTGSNCAECTYGTHPVRPATLGLDVRVKPWRIKNTAFSPAEYIAADDPLAAAKEGTVVRRLTIPETVLQVPETSAGLESMPHLPPSDVEPDLGSNNKAPGGGKREREEDSGWETEPAPRRLKDMTPALALRRSNRRQAPPRQ
ncbi:hypothetical protein B0H14DRAFT_2655499 [Mycena olivaceomarginata]|nr:hypothetical protein B0H14DRAFT_2655499 [Mycena olivaceomarginata]